MNANQTAPETSDTFPTAEDLAVFARWDAAREIATDDRLRALQREAHEAGDEKQVVLCDAALAGDADALVECARVLADAASA